VKKKNNRPFPILVALCLLGGLFVLSACDDDPLSKPVNHVQIPYTPRLVVQSFICPQDSVIRVSVLRTEPTVGKVEVNKGKYDFVKDALVTLSDGTTTVTVPYDKNWSVFRMRAEQLPIVAGKTYYLSVRSPDGLRAEASCTVPASVVDISSVKRTREKNDKGREKMVISWQDIAGEANYYRVMIMSYFSNDNYFFLQNELTYDPLTDEGKDGQRIFSQRMEYQESYPKYPYVLLLCNVDRPYYEFHRTFAIQVANRDNPFAEPSLMYTNIQGGLGVFAAYNRIEIPL